MTAEQLQPLRARAAAPEVLALPADEFGLTWRGLTLQDVPAVHALSLALEANDRLLYRSTEAEIAHRLESVGPDDRIGGFDARGELGACGMVSVEDSETTRRAFLDGGIRPDLRAGGLGGALLDWQIGRARQIIAAADQQTHGLIVINAEATVPEVALLARERGMTPRRYYTDLRRDLAAEILDVSLDRTLEVVPWTPDLDDHARVAHNESFAAHWGSEPYSAQRWSQDRDYFAPEWSFLVLDRTSDRAQVVGYLLSARYEQDWEILGWSEGYIEMLGVRPDWRNRRIATALVTRAMRAYASAGIEYASVGVDAESPSQAYGLFSPLGFEPIHGSTMCSLEL